MALEPAEMRDDESTFGGTAICDGNSSGKDLVSVSVGWSIKSHVGILPYPSNVKCAKLHSKSDRRGKLLADT